MSTQTENLTNDERERMRREELRESGGYREVRDDEVIDARGEETSSTTKPIITPNATPSATKAEKIEQSTAPVEGARVPNAGFGTPNVTEHKGAEASERWQHIQAEFVDDPRKAVGEAHQLVGETVQSIVDAFTKERNELESAWSKGDDVSTEDLRVCLQHYKAFFARLSPTVDGIQHS